MKIITKPLNPQKNYNYYKSTLGYDIDRFFVLIWQNKHKENILLTLLKKYEIKLEFCIIRLLKNYPNIVLEREDFTSFKYLALHKALENYRSNWKYLFVQILVQTFKCMINDYAKKYVNNSHKALNYSSSFEEIQNTVVFVEQSNFVENLNIRLINQYVLEGKEKLTVVEKEVLTKKINGYSNSDIAEILNLPDKAIDNAYYRAILKLKKNYFAWQEIAKNK